MASAIYTSLTCLICRENPHEKNLTAPHTWHGHVVTCNPGSTSKQKVLHAICERCWPEVSVTRSSSCPSCPGRNSTSMKNVFVISPNATLLSTQEPTTSSQNRNDVRHRIPRLQIPGSGAAPATAVQQIDPQRHCSPVVTGVSATVLSASVIGAIVAGILFPPVLLPIIIAGGVSGIVLLVEVTGGANPRGNDRSSGPPSPASIGSWD